MSETTVEVDPERCGGRPVLRGTRFTVEQYLAELYDHASLAVDTLFEFTGDQSEGVIPWVNQRISLITDLETDLLAATDLAKRQCARIEELEAERDARPVARWVSLEPGYEVLKWGHLPVGHVTERTTRSGWLADYSPRPLDLQYIQQHFPTPEAAKGAVEEALRGLSAKTEGA